MSSKTNLITRGTQLSLRRVRRKANIFAADGELSIFDSEEFAYLVNIDIGGQDFWATFDTGSSDLWVVSSGCTVTDCQGVPMYFPSGSSTLHKSSTTFSLNYLLGSVQGSVATEILTLGTIQIASQIFGLANETRNLYLRTTGNSGILGLSFPPAASIQRTMGMTVLDNIFAHLGESDRFFAFKLGRNNSLSDASVVNSSFTIAQLDLPVMNSSGRNTQMTYFPVFKTQSSPYDYWKLPIRNLTINGDPIPLSVSLVPGAPSPIGILDTGTTLILGPTLDVSGFWDSVGTGGSTRYNAQTGLWEVRCDRAVDVRFSFGQGDGGGSEYAVHPEDISWAEGGQKDGWCMGGVQANDGVSSGDWLLGDVFLRNVYVVHQGMTSSKPPLIGLLSLTDPQVALRDFETARGTDPAPPPSVLNRSLKEQWTKDAMIATAMSVVGGFLLGGLITVCYNVRRKPGTTRRW